MTIAENSTQGQGFDPFLLIMIAVFAIFIIFMFRSNRKRQKQQQETQSQVVPGAEVMTNYGLFGIVRDVDDANHVITLETTPGTLIRVHQQTIAKIVTPVADAPASPADAVPPLEDGQGEPRYGQRTDDAQPSDAGETGDSATDGTDDSSPRR